MKSVPGYSNYSIDDDGRVYSCIKNRYLKGLCNNGYMEYYLMDDNGVSRWQYAHRIMCALHHPNPEGKPWVNHKDGNKGNNKADNLEWSTISENIRHAYDTGLKKGYRGKRMPASKEGRRNMSEAAKRRWQGIDKSNYDFFNRKAKMLNNIQSGREVSG